MSRLLAVMGRGLVPPEEPIVAADDLGLIRGDGCFDAARIVVSAGGAKVDHLDRHLARFARSSAALDLPELDEPAWRALIKTALESWTTPGEAALKLVRSRGCEHSPSGLTEFLSINSSRDHTGVRQGIRATTLNRGMPADAFANAPWLLGGVKSVSYAINVAAKREAKRRGVDEAIFVSTDGYLLEAPTAGLIVAADDQLWTTPTKNTGVLRSVTVEVIMDAAAADGVGAKEALFRPEDLPSTAGVWIASAIRGVLPVLELDGVRLPHGRELSRHLARTAGFGC